MNSELRFWRNAAILFLILLLVSLGFVAKGYYYQGKIDVLEQIRQPTPDFPVDTLDYGG